MDAIYRLRIRRLRLEFDEKKKSAPPAEALGRVCCWSDIEMTVHWLCFFPWETFKVVSSGFFESFLLDFSDGILEVQKPPGKKTTTEMVNFRHHDIMTSS